MKAREGKGRKWAGREKGENGRGEGCVMVVGGMEAPGHMLTIQVVLYDRYGTVICHHYYTALIYYFCKYKTSLVCKLQRTKMFHL